MPSLSLLFGQVVRRLRLEAGFSQESFADAIGVHRNYVGTVERGETNITLDNISRIAKGLKHPVWVLFQELEASVSDRPTAITSFEVRRDSAPPPRSIPVQARVAERRIEVREQLAALLGELNRLENLGERKVPRKDRKKRK